MQRFTGTFGVSTLAAFLLTAGFAGAAENNPPKDFKAFHPDNGTGEVLIQERQDATSARQALNGALDSLTTYFDARPRVLGATTDDGDTEIQASFVASRAHEVVSGLVVVHAGAHDAVVGVEFDQAKAFAESKTKLAALLEKNMPETTTAEVSLQRTRLPDGSGAISIPEGWSVNAVNSMVDVVGPESEGHFGLWTPVYTPAGAAYMRSLGVGTGIVPVCDYSDPESAVKVLAPGMAALSGAEWNYVKRLDAAPAPGFPGKAAYLVFDAEIRKDGKKSTIRTLALVDMMPTSAGQWVFYSSWVCAPAETFDKELPTLLNVWKSWKTDDAVFQKRLQTALEDMKTTARIIQDANAYRQHVMDRAADDWSEYIRGTSQVLDLHYDTLSEVPTYNVDRMVDRLNEQAGYERWKIIPIKDINNP
jgi:hypothetical protein